VQHNSECGSAIVEHSTASPNQPQGTQGHDDVGEAWRPPLTQLEREEAQEYEEQAKPACYQ